MTTKITVELDDDVYQLVRLRSIEQDMSASRYAAWFMAQGHDASVLDRDDKGRADTMAPRVRDLVRQGLTDTDIGTVLHLSRETVRTKRELWSMAANRKGHHATLSLADYLHNQQGHIVLPPLRHEGQTS